VHPAYWRRSHGATSPNGQSPWRVRQGVLVVASGEELYILHGFREIGVLRTDDEEDPPRKIAAGTLRYEPKPRAESDPK
jgi:hypothetical protein